MQGCGFRDLQGEFDKKKVVVYGVSFDSEKDNAAFVKKHEFPFRILCDVDGKVASAFGLWSEGKPKFARRSTFLVGPDGKVEKIWEKADVRKNAQAVLDAIPKD